MAAVIPSTNVGRDVAPESEAAQDGKITEIMMDNVDSGILVRKNNGSIIYCLMIWKKKS